MNDNNAIYVQDDTPNAESHYRARFYFDPNSIPMASGNAHYVFYGYSGASTVVLRTEFRCATAACPGSGSYQVRVNILNDSTTWTNSSWFTITDAPHSIELDWKASSAAGANNGYVTLWIDGTQKADLTGVDNDTRRIDRIRLGAVAGIDTGTRGTYYFDALESRRTTYIGPATSGVIGGGKVLAKPAQSAVEAPVARPNGAPAQQSSGGGAVITTTITYAYDPLYRLTSANYSSGAYYDYTYDAVGNRLTQSTESGLVVTYTYDIANRLMDVGGTSYTWDANGNLLNDGVSTYAYDAANRLSSFTQGANTHTYAYNGLGDRIRQTVNSTPTNYVLDLNAGLTQVLSDGANTYLYGLSRIGEQQLNGVVYHLTDALGSVRQLADASGAVTLGKSYEPYGSVGSSAGPGASTYGYTGEQQQGGLVYLRARFYASGVGRFATRDTWRGNYNQPMSYNAWLYTFGNPVNLSDPSGNSPCALLPSEDRSGCEKIIQNESPSAPPRPNPTTFLAENPICDSDQIRWGEPCIPVQQCYPHGLLHPLSIPDPNPQSYKGYGRWFHYLLRTVPGWWNEQGKASEETIVLNMVTLAFSTEISEDQYQDQNTLVGYMAEVFARKAWSGRAGFFYSFIGSRQALKSRLEDVFYLNIGADAGGKQGQWDLNTDARAQRFTLKMSALKQRYDLLLRYGRNILYNMAWHRVQYNRPYEWGNLVQANPRWFKAWINKNAPMLANGEKPIDPQQPGSAIWYAERSTVDLKKDPTGEFTPGTGYVLTYAQQMAMCNDFENGCIGLTDGHEKPAFIP